MERWERDYDRWITRTPEEAWGLDGRCVDCRAPLGEDDDAVCARCADAPDGDPAEACDTPIGMADDGEPPDIDGDFGFDPYSGGPEMDDPIDYDGDF